MLQIMFSLYYTMSYLITYHLSRNYISVNGCCSYRMQVGKLAGRYKAVDRPTT